MNFSKTYLSHKPACLPVWLFFAVVALQLLWVQNQFSAIERVQLQIDYTRKLQLQVHQIVLHRAEENKALLLNRITKINRDLELLKQGGRVSGSPAVLPPLQPLLGITLNRLLADWAVFTSYITTSPDTTKVDAQAGLLLDWFDKLIVDLSYEESKLQQTASWTIAAWLLADALLCVWMVVLVRKKIVRPLRTIAINTANHNHTNGFSANEIGQVARQINEVVENLRDASDFVQGLRV
jgi:methyl-accepting chemotaxis protein